MRIVVVAILVITFAGCAPVPVQSAPPVVQRIVNCAAGALVIAASKRSGLRLRPWLGGTASHDAAEGPKVEIIYG